MGSFSKRDREDMRRVQHICAMCYKPLEDDFEAHAIIPGMHNNPHGGMLLCPECHRKTLSYGKGWRGLTDYYGRLDFDDED
jgi:uncharacterized protein with PIN domain